MRLQSALRYLSRAWLALCLSTAVYVHHEVLGRPVVGHWLRLHRLATRLLDLNERRRA